MNFVSVNSLLSVSMNIDFLIVLDFRLFRESMYSISLITVVGCSWRKGETELALEGLAYFQINVMKPI